MAGNGWTIGVMGSYVTNYMTEGDTQLMAVNANFECADVSVALRTIAQGLGLELRYGL